MSKCHSMLLYLKIIIVLILSCVLFNAISIQAETTKLQPDTSMKYLKIKSLFLIKAKENDYSMENGKKVWNNVIFELNQKNSKIYSEVQPSKKSQEKTIVIYPIFTAAAYSDGGFYDYYHGKCDKSCLTVDIKKDYPNRFESSGNAVQVLKLLHYNFISDMDVDKNPSILDKYDKVIVLHNEYVTKKEFKAITNHKNVIYLYPNALYAEISVNYNTNQITLLKGHGYPDSKIANGFLWKNDNSRFESDTKCAKMDFGKIQNGWMLNCYPETAIHASKSLLKTIRDI